MITAVMIFMAALTTSCFNVDTTKKITLTREEKREVQPTAEELLLADIALGLPLPQWEKGRAFIAADDRSVLAIETPYIFENPDTTGFKGKILHYEGTETVILPDGTDSAGVIFSCEGDTCRYYTNRSTAEGIEAITSNSLPMLIDSLAVARSADRLKGLTVWTKSLYWYEDNLTEDIKGRKFEPVTITDVVAGDLVFPLHVYFADSKGITHYYKMSLGTYDSESRTFASLFSLSDPKEKYPRIKPDVWQCIKQGEVKTGMTKDECRLAKGNPPELLSGHDYSSTRDIWVYPDGQVLYFKDGILIRKDRSLPDFNN